MNGAEAWKIIAAQLAADGFTDCGVADPVRWDTDALVAGRIPPERRPAAIFPGCRAALVIGLPLQRTILDTAPSYWYSWHYQTVNALLDAEAQRIVMLLERLRFRAVALPRDGYPGVASLLRDPSAFFSHRHAAYLAGLGTFGLSGMLLTPDHGPRIRFTTVLTDAELPAGQPLTKPLCTKCQKCTKVCPVGAVPSRPYPEQITDKQACALRSNALAAEGRSPCGFCIRVCPVGRDQDYPHPDSAAIEVIRSYRKAPPTAMPAQKNVQPVMQAGYRELK